MHQIVLLAFHNLVLYWRKEMRTLSDVLLQVKMMLRSHLLPSLWSFPLNLTQTGNQLHLIIHIFVNFYLFWKSFVKVATNIAFKN